MGAQIRKGFINTGAGQVHYRAAGSGPPIILLHDSPRSSVLHTPLVDHFSDKFTAIAIDTPGYGNSTPLPSEPRPEIADFAGALAETILGFGVERCPVYGFHTSSKILLEFAANHPERVAVAIMDGISLPPGDTDHAFIKSYMHPFTVTDTGSYLGEEWTRVRDFQRFFPWFAKTKAARLPMAQRDMRYFHEYSMDLFMAGPHFSDAYSGAMRYKAQPVIPTLTARCVFMAREDDVLYGFLDSLPDPLPEGSTIERLSPDRDAWKARLGELFSEHADFDGAGDFSPPDPLQNPLGGMAVTRGYVNAGGGQVLVRRAGRGNGTPVIFLHDLPGSARADEPFLKALGHGRPAFGVDLPGCNDSDALSEGSLDAYVKTLGETIDALGLSEADVVAYGLSTPLALKLAAVQGGKVRRLVLDAVALPDDGLRTEMKVNYLPDLRPHMDGTHLHRCWQMLRDQEIHWPWYDGGVDAIRKITPDLDATALHIRMVDTLKQWKSAGDAIAAAIESNARAVLGDVNMPVLVFDVKDDARYRWAEEAVSGLPHGAAVPRLADPAARARAILAFLDA
jgi:pimeloyl-ACP methyl ester carboxylesterase